ncbi:MAG: hypothetical protein Q7S19_02090 [bacterium]|nr:hypothetical protein [bacterium]
MLKMHWPLVYAAAIFLDVTLAVLEWLRVGIVFNYLITLPAGFFFAQYFYITDTKGWIPRVILVDGAESIPVLKDLMQLIPIWWTLTIWRIHKKNAAVGVADFTQKVVGKVGGEIAGEVVGGAVDKVPGLGHGVESQNKNSKEAIVTRQIEEDQLQPA